MELTEIKNKGICELCTKTYEIDSLILSLNAVIMVNGKEHPKQILCCGLCFNKYQSNERDLENRIIIEGPIEIWKLTKKVFPTKERKYKLKDTDLFSPLATKGSTKHYK